jgi:hypothetical protein
MTIRLWETAQTADGQLFMVGSRSSRAQLLAVLVLLVLIPATRSSHGLWRDPYGEEVAKDGPVSWWRFENVGTEGERWAECESCASPSPAACKVVPEWAGSFTSVISGTDGIPGSNMGNPALDIAPKVKFEDQSGVELASLNCTDPANVNATACIATSSVNSTNATNASEQPAANPVGPAPSLGVLGRAASFPGR